MNKVSPPTSDNSLISIGPWVAFDMEWELESTITKEKTPIIEPSHPYNNELTSVTSEPPEYHRILTFAYEDNYGNTRVLDVTDFAFCQNPQQDFLLAIRNKLLLYNYCFAWGSKAVKYKNEKTDNWAGIDGDLAVLDTNFRQESSL